MNLAPAIGALWKVLVATIRWIAVVVAVLVWILVVPLVELVREGVQWVRQHT